MSSIQSVTRECAQPILFIADIHIKLGQRNVPKGWAKKRYAMLWDYVVDTYKSNNCKLLILGGDIFDDLPKMEELAEYFSMLKRFAEDGLEVLLYPGNHEALKKHSSFLEYLSSATTAYSDKFTILENFSELDTFDVLPYPDLHKSTWHGKKGKVLFTHVRGAIPPHVTPEVPLNLFEGYELVVAGDLHAHSNSQLNLVYPGSPLTTSFHRKRTKGENGAILVWEEKPSWEFVSFDLPQLLRRTVESEADMVPTEYDHTIYELVGTSADLANVSNSLLDKKISKRVVESQLNLSPEATMEEELITYLKEVEKVTDVAPYLTMFESL